MRTDNDTWDITSSVGATALFVAASRALEANKPDPLVVDPYAEIFCRAVGGEWADVLDGKAPDNKLMSEFGEHFVNYQAARTKYFDDYFYARGRRGRAPDRDPRGRPRLTCLPAGLAGRDRRLRARSAAGAGFQATGARPAAATRRPPSAAR